MVNTTKEFISQTSIDRQVLACLKALEAAVEFIGKRQEALFLHSKLSCDSNYQHICMTGIPYNHSQAWDAVQTHLRSIFSSHLSDNIDLYMTLYQQLQHTEHQLKNEWADSWEMWSDLNPFSLTASTHLKFWITLGSKMPLLCLFLCLCRITLQAIQKQKKDQELVMRVLEHEAKNEKQTNKTTHTGGTVGDKLRNPLGLHQWVNKA